MVESFLQPEVRQVVGAHFVADEHRELSVLLDEGFLAVSAKYVMAVTLAVEADAENLAALLRGQSPEAQFAATFEEFVNGEMALGDEVVAVLDLRDGIKMGKVSLLPFACRERGSQMKSRIGAVPESVPDSDRWRRSGAWPRRRRPGTSCFVSRIRRRIEAAPTPQKSPRFSSRSLGAGGTSQRASPSVPAVRRGGRRSDG